MASFDSLKTISVSDALRQHGSWYVWKTGDEALFVSAYNVQLNHTAQLTMDRAAVPTTAERPQFCSRFGFGELW